MSPQRMACLLLAPTAVGLLLTTSAGLGQQKNDKPAFPPIKPDQAKLDQTFNGLNGPGLALAVSDQAGMVAAACDQSTIQIWHKDVLFGIRSGDSTANILSGHTGTVTALAWNGGPLLASVGADKKILLWDAVAGKVQNTLPVEQLVRTLAMSADGKLLASAGDSNTIQTWTVADGKAGKQFTGHSDWVLCLAFSADGKYLASGGFDGTALLWDLASGNKVRELPINPKKGQKDAPAPVVVTEVSFSPDGKQVAVGRADGIIDLVNTDNGQLLRQCKGHTSAITGLAFHPSGTLLVSSSKDGTLRLWNPANAGQFKSLEGHQAWVEDVAFFAEGTRLASVSADRTVRVWNLTGS